MIGKSGNTSWTTPGICALNSFACSERPTIVLVTPSPSWVFYRYLKLL